MVLALLFIARFNPIKLYFDCSNIICCAISSGSEIGMSKLGSFTANEKLFKITMFPKHGIIIHLITLIL